MNAMRHIRLLKMKVREAFGSDVFGRDVLQGLRNGAIIGVTLAVLIVPPIATRLAPAVKPQAVPSTAFALSPVARQQSPEPKSPPRIVRRSSTFA